MTGVIQQTGAELDIGKYAWPDAVINLGFCHGLLHMGFRIYNG